MTNPANRHSLSLYWGWGLFAALIALLHTFGVGQPFLGNFAQHQTDYATVVQRWLETGIDPLNPVMRFLALGKNRLFYGDFPLNITLVALVCRLTGVSIEIAGRGLSAFYFLISLWPFYRLTKSFFRSSEARFWAMVFYAFSPLTLIYGQSFLLEMSALSFALFGFSFLVEVCESERKHSWVLSAVFFSLMGATRIYFLPLLAPAGFLLIRRYGRGVWTEKKVYFFFAGALLLPLLWQGYAAWTAGLRGDESSLSDNLRVFVKDDTVRESRGEDPFYYGTIIKIAAEKLLNPLGGLLALLGLLGACARGRTLLFLWGVLASFALVVGVAPRKFVEFEYYYLPFVPVLAVAAAGGWMFLRERFRPGRWVQAVLFGGLLLLSLRFSIAPIAVVPAEDRHVLEAARRVQSVTEPGMRVIASHGSSTSFLYYTGRDGWPFTLIENGDRPVRNLADHEGTAVERLERFRMQGAQYFALANKHFMKQNPPFFEYLRKNYYVAFESNEVVIFDLRMQR